MRRFKLLVIAIAFSYATNAQQQITLDSCLQLAYKNLLFDAQYKLLSEGRFYAIEGNNYLNLPAMELNGNATIQNEQISIPVAIPGFTAPEAPLNFNRLLVNFNQTIFNGNMASKKKLIDSLAYDEQLQSVEIEKIKIKSQVIGVYTTLLLLKTNKAILDGQFKVLDNKYKQLQGAVGAGVSTKSKLLTLEAELLKLQQRQDDLKYTSESLIKVLNNYTGLSLTDNVSLVMPTPEIHLSQTLTRPELKYIGAKIEGLEAKKALVSNARLPYIGLFGTIGLGYPGYNIFDESVRPMILGGVTVRWNIWDWNKTKNEKAQITVSQSILQQQHSRTELAFNRELVKQQSEVEKFKKLSASDNKIIEAQEQVSLSMSSEFTNGVATAADYTTQLNSESTAKLNKELHHIQMVLAILTYNTLKGE